MTDFSEQPKLRDILMDDLVNNGIGRFVYKGFANTIDFKGDESVLEFGCGSGSLSRHILKKIPCGKLCGIDISKYQVERAKKRLQKYKNIKLTTGDIREKMFECESFDIAVIHYVLHHVEKANRQETVDEIFRLLKDNGLLYIKEPHRENDGMPKDEIEALMIKAGFSEIKANETDKYYYGIFKKN